MLVSLIELISLFTIYNSKTELIWIICEGVIGACDIISIIIAPLWIDKYGIRSKKILFFILAELAIPLGRCIGYILIHFLTEQLWKKSLIAVMILTIISFCLFISFPYLYFSSKIQAEIEQDGIKNNEKIERRDSKTVSLFQIRYSNNSTVSNEEKMIIKEIIKLLKNPIFICGIISKLFLVFIQTIFFFRISSYMSQATNINDNLKTIAYLLILFIGPIGGVILGVLITSCRLSYDKKHSGLCLVIFYFITCAFAQGMLFKKQDDILFIVFSIGLFMFCSSTIPMVQGILISSINNEAKRLGYSFSHIFTLIFGVGLSLYIYDYIDTNFSNDNDPNSAMKYICYSLFIGLFSSLLVMILNYCKKPQKENGMSKRKEKTDDDYKSRKSKLSRIVEGLGQAYSGCGPNIEDNNDEQLDKSYEKEVNLDDMNDRFAKDDEGFDN